MQSTTRTRGEIVNQQNSFEGKDVELLVQKRRGRWSAGQVVSEVCRIFVVRVATILEFFLCVSPVKVRVYCQAAHIFKWIFMITCNVVDPLQPILCFISTVTHEKDNSALTMMLRRACLAVVGAARRVTQPATSIRTMCSSEVTCYRHFLCGHPWCTQLTASVHCGTVCMHAACYSSAAPRLNDLPH